MPCERLLSPIDCGPLRLKNRIVMAPFPTGLETEDGFLRMTAFYRERAKHGVAMITVSAGIVQATGRRFSYETRFDGADAALHRLLTAAVKEGGAVPVLQLIHAGVDADHMFSFSAGGSVSRVTGRKTKRAPNFYLKGVIRRYAAAARLAVDAGYDGVEIDASGRSLIADFLSPSTNRRRDQWGYSQLAQFKLALDVVKAARKELGDGRALGVRFNLMDLQSDGMDWEGTMRLARMLANAGADYFCCEFGAGDCRIPNRFSHESAGVWTPCYEALAAESRVPVFFGKNSNSLEEVEKLAEKWDNAVFEFSQQLIADRFFAEKISSGCEGAIRRCLGCCSCCIKRPDSGRGAITCMVNPLVLTRENLEVPRAKKGRKVAVVGSGIAGISVSALAAMRGHRVVLYEKEECIGGQLRMMAEIPGKQQVKDWLKEMEGVLAGMGVEIRTVTEADTGMLLSSGNDAVILCTGSEPFIPDIPGIDASNVITYEELILGKSPTGNRVAVMGIDHVSFDIANWLSSPAGTATQLTPEKWRSAWGIGDIRDNRAGVVGFIPSIDAPKRQVYIFETAANDLEGLVSDPDMLLRMQWLNMRGVQMITDVNIDLIDNYSVRYSSGSNGQDSMVTKIDHVVICCGHLPVDSLKHDLEGKEGMKVFVLGSAGRSHEEGLPSLEDAVREAVDLAFRL